MTLAEFEKETAAADSDIKRGIRNVLMHEIAHHFGMNDDELLENGLY